MRASRLLISLAGAVGAITMAASSCGGARNSGFGEDVLDGGGDGASLGDGDPTISNDGPMGKPGCVNLQCKQVDCGAKPTTTVSGIVYDPAGVTPLYNVIVYVPNSPVDVIPHGATCDKCGSVASGSPIVTTLTDTKGHFVLENVPAGKDIPLVIQVGKWRRQVTIPNVTQCTDTAIADKNLTRLPKNKTEGDLPLIALSTGCDPMECLFRKIGIDDSEFTGADSTGSVHIYYGVNSSGPATKAAVGTSTDAYPFWADATALKKYDIVINACECSEFPRNSNHATGTPAYPAMHEYLEAGGRFFGSHFHYNWFSSGPADFQGAAQWTPHGTCNSPPNTIDTSFPKGMAFSDWLVNVGATPTPGTITLSCAPLDVGGTTPGISQSWITSGGGKPSYLSFNTPTDAGVDDAGASNACGRAVFADLHVSTPGGSVSDTAGLVFPTGCKTTTLSPQEQALEFMFFDLASCVQNDSAPPKPPPPK